MKNKPATGAQLLKKTTGQTLLILAEIELIFPIVAITVLCFGYVLETALITQGCFSSCSAKAAPFLFLTNLTSEWAEGAQEAGRAHSTADPK